MGTKKAFNANHIGRRGGNAGLWPSDAESALTHFISRFSSVAGQMWPSTRWPYRKKSKQLEWPTLGLMHWKSVLEATHFRFHPPLHPAALRLFVLVLVLAARCPLLSPAAPFSPSSSLPPPLPPPRPALFSSFTASRATSIFHPLSLSALALFPVPPSVRHRA